MDGRKSDKSAKFNKYAKKIKARLGFTRKVSNTEIAASPSLSTQSLRDANVKIDSRVSLIACSVTTIRTKFILYSHASITCRFDTPDGFMRARRQVRYVSPAPVAASSLAICRMPSS